MKTSRRPLVDGARRLVATTLLPLVACIGAGCGGVPRRFEPEDKIPVLAALKAETLASAERVDFESGGNDACGRPIRLAMHEWGPGNRDRVVVLVHGVLSDSWTWRFMVGRLLPFADVIAVDLPGCGGSEKPALPPGGYSPTALAERVSTALSFRLAARHPSARVVLVGHSLGAATIVRMFASPALRAADESLRKRVDRIVLMSPVDVGAPSAAPEFQRIVETSSLTFAAGSLLGIVDREASSALEKGTMHPERAPREEVDRLASILSDPTRRAAAQAQIRDAMPWTSEGRPDWPKVEALEREYANVDVPCLVVYGARDETIGAVTGYKIATLIRGAQLRLVTNSMHMLPSEQPVACAELIRTFVQGGLASAPKVAWVEGTNGDPSPR